MNNDFYEFDEERRYGRRSRLWLYIPIILISAIIGGILTYTLVPEIFNRFEAGNRLGEADIRNTIGESQAVSYTHLDVYKRQRFHSVPRLSG